jgi:hypothetical protein
MWAVLSSRTSTFPLIQLRVYLEGCTRRCHRIVIMLIPMMKLHLMLDIRLMVTCPQCTVHTRCLRSATPNGIYRPLHHFNKSAGVLGP